MSKKLSHLISLVLVLVVMGTASADQQTITIDNPGFEDPVLDEDGWTWIDVPGWTAVGGEAPGVWHVTINDFDPVVAPEGQNVLYTENAVGDGAGVAQVLTETFAADTDYTLTVEVGNSYYYYNGGYSVQLLAGGTVIAEDNDTLWPEYKTWATSTVQYTYDAAHSDLVGQPLEIRLLNLGLDKDSPSNNTVGVEFDDVTLSYEPGPTSPADPNPADGAIGISSDPLLGAYASDDVPLTIPDHYFRTTTTVTSSLTVSDPNTISDLNVELNISHPTNNADLNVYLTSPDGKKVELFSDVGFQQKNFSNTILDDEAGTSIKNGSGSFSGSFKPEGKLSDFDGRNTQGVWELSISDDFHTNTPGSGTLNSWSLAIESLNVISWVPGIHVASQDVYISANFDDVNDSTDAAYQGNFAADVSSIGIDLDVDQTYFWRVDTLDADGVLIRVGDIWSFSTAPDPLFVDPSSDLAAVTELAKPGGIVHFAEGTYDITSLIEIKEGVTYQGAGAGLTIIDGNNVTRAFVAWGDRSATNGLLDTANTTGPTRWVLDGLTIQNCVGDAANRQDILSAARDLLNNYAEVPYTVATAEAENSGVANNPEWFDALSGGADDDLTDAELQAYLDANPIGSEGHLVANEGMLEHGAAVILRNGAQGTILNCEFLNNTALEGSGDGGAINVGGTGLALTIDNCSFSGNACADAGGALRLVGHASTYTITDTAFTENTTGNDGGAIRADGDNSVYTLTGCTFTGNTASDDGAAVRYGPDRAELTVTNCVFIGNGKDADGNVVGDDGVWTTNDDDCGPMTFENCLFVDNACNDDRLVELKAGFALLNCTFIGNVAGDKALIAIRGRDWDSTGDGNDDVTTDDSIIANCLFINNTMLSDGNVIGDTRNDVFAPAVINCLFFGNLDGSDPASNTNDDSVEVGTIDVSAVTDVAQIVVDGRPVVGSPAVDASDPDTATASDIEGTPAVGVRDVGAYEAPEAPEEEVPEEAPAE